MRFRLVARNDPTTVLPAELFSHISREEYVRTDARWRAYKEKQSKMDYTGDLPDSYRWSWPGKYLTSDPEHHQFFALKYAGEIEGLMMLSLLPFKGPLSKGDAVLYVEYIESAPWNLAAYAGNSARFRGVGESLISVAVQKSVEIGCEGRLGLHSLNESEGFYGAMGFTNLGLDSDEGLHYFELAGYRTSIV